MAADGTLSLGTAAGRSLILLRLCSYKIKRLTLLMFKII